jgi:lipopolysaccharide export system permease protein
MASIPARRNVAFAPISPPGRWLPILDQYILNEMWPPLVYGFAAFLLFWFINIFFIAADYIINKGAPFFLVMRFVLFRVPQATPLAFPFACLFGTLLAFGRLVADNEMTALRTSGVPFWRIARTPLILGMAIFGLSYAIDEKLVPLATDLSTRTFYQIVYKTTTLPIDPQIFRQDPMTGRTFYVGNVAVDPVTGKKTMNDVMIFERGRTSNFVSTTTAKKAYVDGPLLKMLDTIKTSYGPTGNVTGTVHGDNISIGLPLGEMENQFLSSASQDPYTMDSKTLSKDIKVREQTGYGGPDLALRKITLAQKLAYPFAAMISIIIALPLAVKFGKKGRALGMTMAVMMLFVYYALSATTAAFAKNNVMDPYVAAWTPNIVLALAGGFLIFQEDR